ncbi:MAG: tRNA (guanosine(37)-N1)-methyltransferase TrmD [Candidatus Omnitrophica bacterium]|nr:tRNA (guanosine(37)-N1)-methyltransferase TrmD [Candidatus Omnitrophota bacterium]
MKIDILTLFPEMFKGPLSESILKIAQGKGLVTIGVHDLRDWTDDAHRTADDKPFGGGPGMVMKVEPVYRALKSIKAESAKAKIILLTPQGKRLDQKMVKRLSEEKAFIFICGHYEGLDERVSRLVDQEISIGDYILTGGELPACVLIDAMVRLIPGVLGRERSLDTESFEEDLLEYPHYTRPRVFRGMKVPPVLLSGNHKRIAGWRKQEAIKRTRVRRPDLLGRLPSVDYRRVTGWRKREAVKSVNMRRPGPLTGLRKK